jgi:hypothetical protein
MVKYLIDTASKVKEQKQKSKVTWDLSTDSVKRVVEIFRSMIGAVKIKNHIFVIRTELIQLKGFIS